MQNYRMVYVFLKENAFSEWVRGLWEGTLPRKDLLRAQLETRLGEVGAWGGKYPHVSLSDCQVCSDPLGFERIVRSIVELVERPTIKPEKLRIHRGSYLVVDISSPVLERVSRAIRAAMRPLICRKKITDSEWNSAERRVINSENEAEDLRVLKTARQIYEKAGCPGIDFGQHFRLAMLVALTRRQMNKEPDAATASQNLQHFLATSEPPWYGQPVVLHTTVASGLKPGIDTIERFGQLWDEIKRRFGEIEIDHLSIMGQDPDEMVKVRFWDSVTQNFIEEERPRFKVIREVNFGSSSRR